MFIETQDTPNPNSLKCLLPQSVKGLSSPLDFPNEKVAEQHPLAQKCFALQGIKGVLLGGDFITITKSDDILWEHIKPQLLALLVDYFSTHNSLEIEKDSKQTTHQATNQKPHQQAHKDHIPTPARDDNNDGHYNNNDHDANQKTSTQKSKTELLIEEILDARVRPQVQYDGGDVRLVSYEDGIVFLSLKGACQDCPSASLTLKNGIEALLKHFIPEVQEVRQMD